MRHVGFELANGLAEIPCGDRSACVGQSELLLHGTLFFVPQVALDGSLQEYEEVAQRRAIQQLHRFLYRHKVADLDVAKLFVECAPSEQCATSCEVNLRLLWLFGRGDVNRFQLIGSSEANDIICVSSFVNELEIDFPHV